MNRASKSKATAEIMKKKSEQATANQCGSLSEDCLRGGNTQTCLIFFQFVLCCSNMPPVSTSRDGGICTQSLLTHSTVPLLLHVLTADAEHAQRMSAFNTAFIISRMKIFAVVTDMEAL